ncbi:hypothetical protein IM697_21695 [Streptomyces ferrugineus]|uniref:Uncharacterized protein n=1 Tax=Streptomyces ferrugineus TaxID=1413221 RepID=A0A7M2SYX8_9ACTN|nr:hypothetical protein [Streptomyces ferrugineus]QOV40773.1 hypothetical protein IM697_21695 [Streptomyces ferrugineus]
MALDAQVAHAGRDRFGPGPDTTSMSALCAAGAARFNCWTANSLSCSSSGSALGYITAVTSVILPSFKRIWTGPDIVWTE